MRGHIADLMNLNLGEMSPSIERKMTRRLNM